MSEMGKMVIYGEHGCLDETRDSLVVRSRGGRERIIPVGKWWLNRRTPVGEDAEVWEVKPYGGSREIHRGNIVAIERREPEGE